MCSLVQESVERMREEEKREDSGRDGQVLLFTSEEDKLQGKEKSVFVFFMIEEGRSHVFVKEGEGAAREEEEGDLPRHFLRDEDGFRRQADALDDGQCLSRLWRVIEVRF